MKPNMNNEIFVEKCEKTWSTDDWGYYCHNCSLKDFVVICIDCFEKCKHVNHEVELIWCESGVWCDCGNDINMKSQGFCSKHSIEDVIIPGNRNKSNSVSRSRHLSEHKSKESDGFFDGILHSFFNTKPLDLPEFYDLNKISKYSIEGNLILKYFERSKAHNLDIKVKKCYEITKSSHKFENSVFENSKRLLLWYTISKNESSILSKILKNGISYENGKMGRALYFRDRINRFVKYQDKDFGLLLLCDVAVANIYETTEKKHFREIPHGFDSVKGIGKYIPEENKTKTFGHNIIVPIGKTVSNDLITKTDFNINQYMIYDKNQVIVRHLIQYYINK